MWTTLFMAFFVSAACGMVGLFLILRRMALMGDAISHSLLPGIALAFLLAGTRDTLPMFIGAVAAGVLTVVLVEYVQRNSRIKADAAMGLVFSALFATGVILITAYAGQVDLDADCVLYGELALVPLDTPVELWGLSLGTVPVVRMGAVWLGLIVALLLFYRPLLVTTFDAGLARSLGINPRVYHYGLMVALSLVIVSGFEAVGAILVIAMLIIPGATALLLTERLPRALGWTVLLAAVYSPAGYAMDFYYNVGVGGSMVTVALGIFLLVWLISVQRRRWRQRAAIAERPITAMA